MKLYATTTSERASKGQGGNEYLETVYNIMDKNTPSYRVRVINDEEIGKIYFTVEVFFFGKWQEKMNDVIYINVPEKGEKQKGECEQTGCHSKTMHPYAWCEKHFEERLSQSGGFLQD